MLLSALRGGRSEICVTDAQSHFFPLRCRNGIGPKSGEVDVYAELTLLSFVIPAVSNSFPVYRYAWFAIPWISEVSLSKMSERKTASTAPSVVEKKMVTVITVFSLPNLCQGTSIFPPFVKSITKPRVLSDLQNTLLKKVFRLCFASIQSSKANISKRKCSMVKCEMPSLKCTHVLFRFYIFIYLKYVIFSM